MTPALLGEALVSASLLAVAYQDFRYRLVSDSAWIPGAIGLVLIIAFATGSVAWLVTAKVLVLAVLALSWRALGLMGEADVVVLPLLAATDEPASPIPELLLGLALMLALTASVWARQGSLKRKIPVREAVEQTVWVPRRVISMESGEVLEELESSPEEAWEKLKNYLGREDAVVEASYGVPLAGALGVGYVLARLLGVLPIQLW